MHCWGCGLPFKDVRHAYQQAVVTTPFTKKYSQHQKEGAGRANSNTCNYSLFSLSPMLKLQCSESSSKKHYMHLATTQLHVP